MKKMVKVILVCTAALCAIDQIMRPQMRSMRKSTANIASVTRKYLKSLQTVSPALVKR